MKMSMCTGSFRSTETQLLRDRQWSWSAQLNSSSPGDKTLPENVSSLL